MHNAALRIANRQDLAACYRDHQNLPTRRHHEQAD
jgi:hypothetical protein